MGARKTGEVVVVGSFNVDHVWASATLPRDGETLAGDYTSGPGGKGFNQATAAVRAGATTRFICALGNDAGGELARRLARADGIALHAQDCPAATGTAGIFVDALGNNCIVVGAGANAELDATHVAATIGEAAAVLLAQLESPLPAIRTALQAGRAAGATTILNPAPANAATSMELLALADVLTPNESELAALVQRHLGRPLEAGTVASLADARLHALCRHLSPAGTVVVTLGAQGCFVSHPAGAQRGDEDACYRRTPPAARVVDTTGAGDAFNGALAAALAAQPHAAFGEHIAFALAYATASTEHAGAAVAMPWRCAPGR